MDFDPRVDYYEERRRSFIGWIQEPLRSHFGTMVKQVVKHVGDDLLFSTPLALYVEVVAHLDAPKNPAYVGRFQYFLDTMGAYKVDALGYMEWAIWWHFLSDELKQQLRAQRYAELAMEGQEPSEAQLQYLKKLGHVGAPPADMAQASRMINRYVAARAGVL